MPVMKIDAGPPVSPAHRDLDDLMKRGVSHVQDVPALLNAMPFAPKGGVISTANTHWPEQRIAAPLRCGAAAWTGLPDDAIEGIRHVDVSGLVEGQRIEAGTGDRVHEHTGRPVFGSDLEDVPAEIAQSR